MPPSFTVASRPVGLEHPPLVIAEIGINHEGSLETAFEMVDAAKRAGAEIVKHQTHVVDDEMIAAARNVVPGNASEGIYDIMARCALTEKEEVELKRYAESVGLLFISTPFSRAAANRLERMGVEAYKVGSGECNNYPLIRHIASLGKPMILSTGMNTIATVQPAVALMREAGVPFALLHTTSVYPTPHKLVRLGAMVELAEAFPDAVVGLSDHTQDNYSCLGAVALGASILERHFTDRMDRPGPDIEVSMDEAAMRDLIIGSRAIALCRGGTKDSPNEEQVTKDFAFASVVTIAPIAAGQVFSLDNIWVKRPGTGEIHAVSFEDVLGKTAACDVASGVALRVEDVAGGVDLSRVPLELRR
ncbi:MAG: N-acetylneuraminate synthase family protein [Polyangiaceae bacterium]|nr:N-acetylneuraminate synthase family protein [Polyangiaceae bacterium]